MIKNYKIGHAETAKSEESATSEVEQNNKMPKKKNTVKLVLIVAIILFVIIGSIIGFLIFSGFKNNTYANSNNGAILMQADKNMTDKDIYNMLAKQATSMKVHVWQAPAINGDVLSLGFENSASNKYDQAFRVIQDGKTIYESYPVAPGNSVKDVSCKKARVGKAMIEIFNVVDGSIYGNGVRCEVVIIGKDSAGGKANRVEDITGVLNDKKPDKTK